MGSLTTFLSLYSVIAAKTLDHSAIRPNPLSSMLLEIFNCFCAIVKHCSFVSILPLCWESMIFKSQGGDAWKLLQKAWKISRVIPVSTVSFDWSCLMSWGSLWWEVLQIQKVVDEPFMSCRACQDQGRLQQLFSPFRCALCALGLWGCRRQPHTPSGMWWECAGRGTWPLTLPAHPSTQLSSPCTVDGLPVDRAESSGISYLFYFFAACDETNAMLKRPLTTHWLLKTGQIGCGICIKVVMVCAGLIINQTRAVLFITTFPVWLFLLFPWKLWVFVSPILPGKGWKRDRDGYQTSHQNLSHKPVFQGQTPHATTLFEQYVLLRKPTLLGCQINVLKGFKW